MTHPEKQGKARVQSTLRTPPLCTAPVSQAHSHAQSNVMVRPLAGRASRSPHDPHYPRGRGHRGRGLQGPIGPGWPNFRSCLCHSGCVNLGRSVSSFTKCNEHRASVVARWLRTCLLYIACVKQLAQCSPW